MRIEELYYMVWAPLTETLANEYSISDDAPAKFFKKLSIPKPPRGYWAQRSWSDLKGHKIALQRRQAYFRKSGETVLLKGEAAMKIGVDEYRFQRSGEFDLLL